MQIICYVAIALGLYIAVRSVSLLSLYLKLIRLRGEHCIARIIEQQKACDRIIAAYYLVSVFVGLWIAALGLYVVTVDEGLPWYLIVVAPACLCVFYVSYYVYRAIQMKKFELSRFHDDMVAYRSAQKTVTPDNDHEVNFLRAFKQVKKQSWLMLFWAVLTVAIFICYGYLWMMAFAGFLLSTPL